MASIRSISRIFFAVGVFALIFALVFFARTASADSNVQLLVKYQPNATPEQVKALDAKFSTALTGVIPRLGVRIVQVPASAQALVIERLKAFPQVAYVEPDAVAQAFFTPNDTYISEQWGLSKINAFNAWENEQGDSGVKIAILDTGVDFNHGDLSSQVIANKDFTGGKNALDRNGHGTAVAGIADAVTNNAHGIAGVGFNSSLLNGKVLSDNGSGYYSWIAAGIVWAADNGAKVINLSLGGPTPSQTLSDAVDYAWSKGVVIVAAAGNDATSTPSYPAFYQHVIAVAATDQNDQRAAFSDYGDWVTVAAPGVSILSTYPHIGRVDRYAYMTGTSAAAPFVSGLAALIWDTASGTDNQTVLNRIKITSDPLLGAQVGAGRINAARAVTLH